jgi:hypothetical protein
VVVDAGQQRRVAADVVAGLAELEAAAHHQVVGLAEVDLGVAFHQGAQRDGGEVVGPHVLERALGGAANGRPHGVDDDGFGHRVSLLVSLWRRGSYGACG